MTENKKGISYNKSANKEVEIISFLKNNSWSNDTPKICCIYQKNTLSDKIIGIAYLNLNLSFDKQHHIKENNSTILEIYFGEYPSYDINSFLKFLAKINPDMILYHGHSESILISLLNKIKIFKDKIKEISFINYKLKKAQIIIQDYLENYSGLSHIQSMTKTSDILSYNDYNAQCAMFILFTIFKKIVSGSGDPPPLQFRNIFFNDLLYCSPKTKNELCIFQYQLHPSLIKGYGKGKEGLSIFNLFNKCSTVQGKRLLKHMILFPLKDQDKLNKRYQCIQDLSDINNFTIIKGFLSNLSTIKDLEIIIDDLKSFVINPKVWILLDNSLSGILRIYQIMNTLKKRISILSDILDNINFDDIQKIYDFLSVCFEFWRGDEVPIIKEGVSDTLDEINKQYRGIDEILQKKASEYRDLLPKNTFFDEFQICFYPQIGYLIGIIKNEKYKYLMQKYGQEFLSQLDTKEYFEFPLDEIINNNINNIDTENNKKISSNYNTSISDINSEEKKEQYKGGRQVSNIMKLNDEEIIENNNSINTTNKNEKNKSNDIMTQIKEEQENEDDEKNMTNFNKMKNNNEIKENIIEENDNDNDNEIEIRPLTNYEETLILIKLKIQDTNDLKFQFHDEKLIYYKNYITEELDTKYGDLQSKLLDCENNVFRQISKQILSFENELIKVNKFIAFLDIFIHFSIFADKYQLYKPLINSDVSKIEFKEGRNVITEILIGANYIPSSFNSNEKTINIISGPISSGKTIFLSLIGTLTYLAQIGTFIPAMNYKSCIFKMILSNLSVSENNIDQLSGFTTEAKEIKKIIDIYENEVLYNEENKENNNVLILLDTPFKKTSEKNQNCLIGGILKYIYDIIDKNPRNKSKIFITFKPETLKYLKDNNLINEKYTNIFEMETLRANNNINSGNNININNNKFIQTYKLKEKNDKNRNSNFEVDQLFLAKELGLDNSLFLRSLEIENLFKKKQKIFPDLEKFMKYTHSLEKNKKDIYDKIMEYTQNNISLESDEKEINLIKYLADKFN
jgi:DNA mismatch repair ATPase MutS